MTRLDIRRDSGYERYGVGDINMMTRGGGDQCEVTIQATVNIEQAQFLQDAMREGIELQVTPAGGSQYTFMPPMPLRTPESDPVPVRVGQVWSNATLNGEKTIKKLSFVDCTWRALYNECSNGQYFELNNQWCPISRGWQLVRDVPSE